MELENDYIEDTATEDVALVDDQEDQYEAEPASDEGPSEEERARSLGWVSADEWNGDPDRHISAEEFNQKAQNNMPLMKKNNDALHRELHDMRKLLTETIEQTKRREQQAYERGLQELKAKQRKAVEDYDVEAYDKITAEIEEMEAPSSVDVSPQGPAQYVQEFTSKHADWWGKDFAMTQTAIGYDNQFAAQGVPEEQRSQMIEDALKRDFPNRFKSQSQDRYRDTPRDIVTAKRKPAAKPNAKSFESLPADAKEAYKKLERQFKVMGKEYTKEQYLEHYKW